MAEVRRTRFGGSDVRRTRMSVGTDIRTKHTPAEMWRRYFVRVQHTYRREGQLWWWYLHILRWMRMKVLRYFTMSSFYQPFVLYAYSKQGGKIPDRKNDEVKRIWKS